VTDDQRPLSPEPAPRAPRTAEARAADHAAIDRLAEDLVPALIAKLSASGLGEIEVAEEAWTIRVRRPSDASGHTRRVTDKASRSQPGHAGHGHAPGSFEGHRGARDAKPAATTLAGSTNGAGPVRLGVDASSGGGHRPVEGWPDSHRVVATSPAVGVFQPRTDIKPGTRVRDGDRLGAVDMLGIPQEVLAPADGILGASLVEAGQAVEYGQELIVIELAGRALDRSEA
jgi:biotin carboxyl carrier protein